MTTRLEEQRAELLRQMKELQRTSADAKQMLGAIRARLEAPFIVRAWHQACGHEGWGAPFELVICLAALFVFAAVGATFLMVACRP